MKGKGIPKNHSESPIGSEETHEGRLWTTAAAMVLYLQFLIFVGVALFVIRTTTPRILGTVTFSAEQIVSLTNQKRVESGLPPLAFNSQLASAAAAKASDMIANDYWAHNSPSGKTPWSFITAAGYKYVYAGENLARDFDDAGSVVDAWMNSSSHRENLLDKNFKDIGVAVQSGKLAGREGILVVQHFGASVSSTSTTSSQGITNTTGNNASPSPKASFQPAGASAVASPSASPVASPSPSPSPSPVFVAAKGDQIIVPGVASEATVLASRKFSIAKMVSLSVIGFIFILFALEVTVTLKRQKVYLRSGVVAHLLMLGFVLLAVWYAVSGAIL